jgi:putative beta-lysine N-acetyltransferase
MPDDRAGCLNQVESGSGYTMHVCLDFANKRLRVDDYDCQGNTGSLRMRITELAERHALTKVFVKSREEDWQSFLSEGYMLEGIYKGYFLGRDAYCMALYFDPERRTSDYWLEEDAILRQVLRLPAKPDRPEPPEGYVLRIAVPEDAERLAALYGHIFQTYPTPMNDASYVEKVLRGGTLLYLVESSGLLVSAASAEINETYRNAEITDCATLPAFRQLGLMRLLIIALEEELHKRKIHCAYSLARAPSFGMNASLSQLGYRYYGRLTKNCDIYDKYEDMNLWSKTLASV